MKQHKLKTLALALALALVLTLAVGMFVACDPKDNNSDNANGTATSGIAKIFSEDQYNALMGYVYSADLGKEGSAGVAFYYYSADAVSKLDTGDLTAANGVVEAMLSVSTGTYDETTHSHADEKTIIMTFLSSPEEATAVLDSEIFADYKDMALSTVGNIAVAESQKGLFENHVAKATIPSTVSAARKQMLQQSYDKMANAYRGYGSLNISAETEDQKTTTEEDCTNYIMPEHGNCEETFSFYTADADAIQDEQKSWEEEKKFYTDDSYCNTTNEPGYVFYYCKHKPGFTYAKIDYGNDKGKLRIYDYYYNEDVVDSLSVPAKIDGKDVAMVYLDDGISVKNISVEEGILSLFLSDNLLKNITLPTSLTSLTLSSKTIETLTLPTNLNSVNLACESLKTVNYAGSTADFEAKFGSRAKEWCHITTGYDETTHQTIYKDITITVVCNDGSLTYPQKDAKD